MFHYEADGRGPAIGHGLRHPTIQPYRDYKTRGDPVLISVQNEREFVTFCKGVLEKPELLEDSRFKGNVARCQNSEALDREIEQVFMRIERDELIQRLKKERIAYGQVNGMRGFSQHPALQRVPVKIAASGEVVQSVAAPARFNGEPRIQGEAPAYGQHSEAIRKEYADPLDIVASEPTTTASLAAELLDDASKVEGQSPSQSKPSTLATGKAKSSKLGSVTP